MELQKMMPSLDAGGLANLFMQGQWHVEHGSIDRFPGFLRPDDGALSNIGKLESWPRFVVGYRDGSGNYRQVKATDSSPKEYYAKGALINSRSIEEMNDAARDWLGEWTDVLGVARDELRLNSWAVRGASGIDWHFDPEDVIHFQIKGDKLFKLLRTPVTHFADVQTKKVERILASELSFDEASEEIVREGTVTVIPRGVWHWTEGKSDESFAVSLCINTSSYAQTLSMALYKRLRLIERLRMPILGSPGLQCEALDSCAKEAEVLLNAMDYRSLLAQERRLEFPVEDIGSFYFFLGSRARASLKPLRMWVDGQELAVQGDNDKRTVLQEVCKLSYGFRADDLSQVVPHVSPNVLSATVASLVRLGFLDFLDEKVPS